MMAVKDGDWEEYKRIFKVEVSATEWAFDRIREAFEKSGKGRSRKLEHRTGENDVEVHRFPAAYHRASGKTRRCHSVVFVPTLQLLSS